MTWGKDAWVPVRKGKIYCSPACGADCTRTDYLEANNLAMTLARKMGWGWKPEVWENMGWYYKVVSPCKRIKVHPLGGTVDPTKPERYHAFLGEPDCGGGRWVSSFFRDPREAVKDVVRLARKELAEIGAVIEGL